MHSNGSYGGKRRWRCRACRLTRTRATNPGLRQFTEFLDWMNSGAVQRDMAGAGRSFRRHNQQFWAYWPIPEAVQYRPRVVFLDGLFCGHRTRGQARQSYAHLLIASTQIDGRAVVLGWHLAPAERYASWASLLEQIPAPALAVTDGAPGIAKALRHIWPASAHQRCLVHVQRQILAATTRRPRTRAGFELKQLGLALTGITNLDQAQQWTRMFHNWTNTHRGFLAEKTRYSSGQLADTHRKLVRARSMMTRLIHQGVLFTFLDQARRVGGDWPATNNVAESINARLRATMRDHRGQGLARQLKMAMFRLALAQENPPSPAEMLSCYPTDHQIEQFYADRYRDEHHEHPAGWGSAIAWHELHTMNPYRYD